MTERLSSSGFFNSSLVLTQSILHIEARWSSKNLSWTTSYCCQKLSDTLSMEEWKWTLPTVPQRPHVSCHHAPHHLQHSLPLHELCSNHTVFCLFSEHTKLRTFALADSSAWKTLPPVFIWLTHTYLYHPIKVHLLSRRGLPYRLLSLKDAPPPLHFWHFLTHHAFIVFTSLCLQLFYLFVGLFYSCSSPLLLSLPQAQFFN